MDEQGKWSVSPAYDLTFSLGINGEHSMMYMGEGKNPTLKHLQKLANKHNIKEVNLIIDEVKEAVSRWKEIATGTGVSRSKIRSMGKFMDSVNR